MLRETSLVDLQVGYYQGGPPSSLGRCVFCESRHFAVLSVVVSGPPASCCTLVPTLRPLLLPLQRCETVDWLRIIG